jgi:hypothetical protein
MQSTRHIGLFFLAASSVLASLPAVERGANTAATSAARAAQDSQNETKQARAEASNPSSKIGPPLGGLFCATSISTL